ncbi:hypothetical protein FE257_011226 [Aspergillus nanangensis]|uniref:Cytochrome P450 alkane hydroxylase n=1 Tax=Aspergillus nanangensis TaxID=2582783 RepID=A0AAD4CJF5_ASPNN|nr:hypothetical protein FE257_011226 [Aspergillus nanangensis]
MSLSISYIVAFALLLTFLYYLYQTLRRAQTKRQWNCQPPPVYPSDILGINTLQETLRADRKREFPQVGPRRAAIVSAREHRPVTTFRYRQMGRNIVYTCEPRNVQTVLATKFEDFVLGETRRMAVQPLLGKGIFSTDGPSWSHSRALLRPQFHRDQISDLALTERHVQLAMRAISPTRTATGWSTPVDIQAIFFRLTIDSASEFLFGKSVESQAAALAGHVEEFAFYFDKAQHCAVQRARYEALGYFVGSREAREAHAYVHRYVDRIVEGELNGTAAAAAAAAAAAGPTDGINNDEDKNNNNRGDNTYIFLQNLVTKTRDPLELRNQLLNILVAGRDTTASLLSFAILSLAQHPRVFAKLRATIIATFGPYNSNPTHEHEHEHKHEPITFTSLKSCRYLQFVINETLRLYPAVPVNRRFALRDTTLPVGGGPSGLSPVYIRRGQPVVYSVFAMQRRRDLWGQDAEEFVPERWEGRKPGWEYLPFNGGPRLCLGQQFALTEAAYVLVRLLQRFDRLEGVGVEEGVGEVGLMVSFTMSPARNVVVRVHEGEGQG